MITSVVMAYYLLFSMICLIFSDKKKTAKTTWYLVTLRYYYEILTTNLFLHFQSNRYETHRTSSSIVKGKIAIVQKGIDCCKNMLERACKSFALCVDKTAGQTISVNKYLIGGKRFDGANNEEEDDLTEDVTPPSSDDSSSEDDDSE